GGWPLSAFLMPDMSPYFVGTYFPPHGAGEQIGFIDLIKELNRAYNEDFEQVKDNASKVKEVIAQGIIPSEPVEFPGHFPPPMSILHALKEMQDNSDGGYGDAPKFPLFPYYEWAVEQILEGMIDQERGEHIFMTLERVLMGGIYDQARGGIHRYSTDKKWLVPHFEKMLYDQAGLIRVLAKLSIVYSSPIVFDTLYQTLIFLKAEMLSEKNYMFASHDADSEGQEGLYFTYTQEEFHQVLSNIEWEEEEALNLNNFPRWFGISEEGNFERGLNVISLDDKLKKEFFTPQNWNSIRKIKNGLLEHRNGRIPPATDPKGVASWNFMMITAMVDVMQYCQIDAIRAEATDIFNHLVDGMHENFFVSGQDKPGMQIRHTTTQEHSLPYLEDYVFFAEAQLRIYEITGQKIFRDNCYDTVKFIFREFVDGNQLKTRANSTTGSAIYPNQNQTAYDNSYRSTAMTFIGLVRRLTLLVNESDFDTQLAPLIEEMTQQTLKNPLNAGEGLRSLTYPSEAYKIVKVPLHWLQDSKFLDFISYFMPRFVFDYQRPKSKKETPSEHWQLCSSSSCELSGEGLENFIQTFRPPTDNDDPKLQEREIRK
ncbi:MAG: thioredoxin domain-containing protein, partial [Bdellovibrionales bacterium]|nr:thioredoxin domain-containing protein [Bdellovibrionales bacterium]